MGYNNVLLHNKTTHQHYFNIIFAANKSYKTSLIKIRAQRNRTQRKNNQP